MADKRLRTMVFPGLEDTYTIPQDMNDLESIEAVAEPYDEFASYAIGDYCSNGGKFYRCNTAIPSGETWNANHWTETNVGDEILAEKAATSTALSGKVSKAGDTMTGNLVIEAPSNSGNYGIYENSQYLDSNNAPSSDTYNIGLRMRDKNNVQVSLFNTGYLANGNVLTQVSVRRQVNGSNLDNYMRLVIKPDGTREVAINAPAAWRTALGVEDYTIDNSMATFTENISGTNTKLIRKNKSIIVYYQGEAKTHATNDVLFTLNSGYRPSFQLYVPCTFNQAGFGVIEVNVTGVVRITQISSGGGASARVYAHFTFPIA